MGTVPGKQGTGGWGGIRTHGGLAPTPVFKTGALNHSATHPAEPAANGRKEARHRIRGGHRSQGRPSNVPRFYPILSVLCHRCDDLAPSCGATAEANGGS